MRLAKILACSVAIAAMSTTTFAQGQGREGRRGGAGAFQQQRMSPEQSKAVWTWQAKDIAHELELSEDKTAKVVSLYLEARKEYGEALQKAMEEARRRFQEQRESGERGGAGARGGLGFNTELADEHGAALRMKLSETLQDDKKARKAAQVLGTFSRQWDQMTSTLIELELDEDKAYEASEPIRAYTLAMEDIRNSGDRQAMRERFMEARETRMADLGKVLSEEQVAQFDQRRQRG